MTAARFIACVCSFATLSGCAGSSVDGRPPVLGGTTLAPGDTVVYGALGWDVTFPTLSAGATAGVLDGLDLDARYDTRAGLAHDFGMRARGRIARGWAASLSVSHGFFTVEEIGGIQASRAPFGNGVAIAPAVHASLNDTVSFGLGATLRMTRLSEDLGVLSRELDPFVESAWLDVAAEWADASGTSFVALRAVVPVQAELRVLGYLPWITLGRAWDLR